MNMKKYSIVDLDEVLVGIEEIELIKFILKAVNDSLKDRIDDVEYAEPFSDGSAHDKWEEKYEDLVSIQKDVDDLINMNTSRKTGKEKFKDDVKRLCESIDVHQLMYGGLKRTYFEIGGLE